MSKTEISFKNNFIKVNNEKGKENFNEKIDINKIHFDNIDNENNKENNEENNNNNENKNNEYNNENNKNNSSFNELNPNYSLFRECFNYYLSYYYEQDFIVDEKEEPQNAGFFARLFGNHPKIYQILPELKSERNFIIFLKNNTLSNENDMFNKIFGQILNFIENSISDLNIEEDKIIKKNNPSNLIKKSYKLLKEKMKSFNMMKTKNDRDIFEEFNINSIPLLMILQLLYIIEHFPNFIESFINKCFPNEKEIILAFSFYLSSIEFDRLLSGRLNIFFNRDKIVFDKYIEFYLGLFEQSFELFESNKNSYYELFSGIQSEAENMPSSIFWKTNTFKLKYPAVKTDSSLSHYFNSSSMNQK